MHGRLSRSALATALLLLGSLLSAPGPVHAQFEEWSPTGSMSIGRYGDGTITRLCDGRVLVTGGTDGVGYQATAEVYVPALGVWVPTSPMSTARSSHTATLLNDCRVLVAGGQNFASQLSTAEIYDPVMGTWSQTERLPATRLFHTANLLFDGRVLVAAGSVAGSASSTSTALYDPASGTWSAATPLNHGRNYHRGVTLADGRVLIAGGTLQGGNAGISAVTSEIYDPAKGTWTVGAQFSPGRWQDYSLSLLEDGRGLLLGGVTNWTLITTNRAHAFDPASGGWTEVAPIPTTRRVHTATLLLDGRVLLAGGNEHPNDFGPGTNVATAYLFDPSTGWSQTDTMEGVRHSHLATRLLDGRVLVAGGHDGTNFLSSAEIYTPDPTKLLG